MSSVTSVAMKGCFCFTLALVVILTELLSTANVGACVDVGFYDRTCPTVETLVQQTVAAAFNNNSGVAPALIRLHFHDCFVRGCDGSVLIDSTANNTAEKDAGPNFPSLRFFEVIDAAKAAVEAQCPRVVSCADILAFAARDSVALAGGLSYQVPAGRRDGRISIAQEVPDNLPAPTSPLPGDLVTIFSAKNLTVEDIVVLSGAHTIGVSHCIGFAERLYSFTNTTDGIDPKLSKAYAFLLQKICPPLPITNQTFPNTTTFMDIITPTKFDNKYYGLTNNLGLFQSDNALLANSTMKALVDSFVRSEATWKRKFVRSMLKMGQIIELSGTQGEIRRNCRVINPTSVHHPLTRGSSGLTEVAAS